MLCLSDYRGDGVKRHSLDALDDDPKFLSFFYREPRIARSRDHAKFSHSLFVRVSFSSFFLVIFFSSFFYLIWHRMSRNTCTIFYKLTPRLKVSNERSSYYMSYLTVFMNFFSFFSDFSPNLKILLTRYKTPCIYRFLYRSPSIFRITSKLLRAQ